MRLKSFLVKKRDFLTSVSSLSFASSLEISPAIRLVLFDENSRNVRGQSLRNNLQRICRNLRAYEQRIASLMTLWPGIRHCDNAQHGVVGTITTDYTLRDRMHSQNARRVYVCDAA